MTRPSPSRVALLLLVPACYSPNDPVLTDQSDDDSTPTPTSASTNSTGSSDGSTEAMLDSESSDPTTSSSVETVGTTDGVPVCGDGSLNGDEVCDDGENDGSYGGCLPDCSGLGPHCGDAALQGTEDCDDGDSENGDGCNLDCRTSGTLVWSRTFDDDYAVGVSVDAQDDLVVVSSDARFLRFGGDGEPGWDETYALAGASATRGVSIAYDDAVGWMAAGDAATALDGTRTWWRTIDSDGVFGTGNTYDSQSGGDDVAGGVAFDSTGNFLVAGWTEGSQADGAWLRKYTGDQGLLWARSFVIAESDRVYGVTGDTQGNIIVVGSTISGGSRDAWIRKYDSEGGVDWTRTSPDPVYSVIFSVAVGGDGTIVAGGRYGDDIWVGAYTPGGVEVWTHIYDSPNVDSGFFVDEVHGVAISSDGSAIAAGFHMETDGYLGAWVRKFSADGDVLWTVTPLSSDDGTALALGVAVDSQDHVVVVGQSAFLAEGVPAIAGWVEKYTP